MMNTVTVYALKDPKTGKYVATGTDGIFLTSDLSEAELFYIYGFAEHANKYLTYGEAKIVTVKITYEEVAEGWLTQRSANGLKNEKGVV